MFIRFKNFHGGIPNIYSCRRERGRWQCLQKLATFADTAAYPTHLQVYGAPAWDRFFGHQKMKRSYFYYLFCNIIFQFISCMGVLRQWFFSQNLNCKYSFYLSYVVNWVLCYINMNEIIMPYLLPRGKISRDIYETMCTVG